MPRFKFVILIFLLALPFLVVAQDSNPAEVSETLEHPRATLTTFFTAMNASPPDLATAATTLDLSEVPPLAQETQGESTAIQLFGIFNRTKFIELDQYPNDPNAEEVTINLSISINRRIQDLPPIVIRKNADGAWRFSAQTVASVPATWKLVKDQPVLGELKDIRPYESVYAKWANENLSGSWLQPGFLGVINWKWPTLILFLLGSYICGLIIRILAKLIIRLKTGRIGSELSKSTLDSAGNGFSLLTNGLIFGYLAKQLSLPPDPKAAVLFLALVITTVGMGWLAMAVVQFLINQLTPKIADNERAEKLFLPILTNLGRLLVIGLTLLFFLGRIGFDITGLIAGLGIGGLVVALAAKDSVENFFGSLTLIFEMPFQIGDWIIADGIEGIVEEISIRSTTIRTFHDSTILVPNSKFIAKPVENMGRRRFRRLKTTLGITYDATPEQVEQFVQKLRTYILEHPKTWDDKINIAFNDYGPSSLNILMIVFIDADNYNDELLIREELLLGVMKIAEECDVHFAFPTQRMIIDGPASPGLTQRPQ